MGKRNTSRKLAMQVLFQTEFQNSPALDTINHYLNRQSQFDETKTWTLSLIEGVLEHKNSLDDLIKKYAVDWEINRMNGVDRNLLRLAFYEMKYLQTPVAVILNEVIELAKKYSTDDSPKFINGILGNFVRKECSPE